jgi:hypothetical protein
MVTRPTNISKMSDNKAIYEILLKILEKWSATPQPIEDTSPVGIPLIISEDNKEHTDFSDEEIITETVLLRPEDFQTDSLDKTVIQDLKTQKTEEHSPGPSETKIPETVIFSTKEIKESSIQSDRTTSAKCDSDQQKQEVLKPVKKSTNNIGQSNKDDKSDKVPETIIFRGNKK